MSDKVAVIITQNKRRHQRKMMPSFLQGFTKAG